MLQSVLGFSPLLFYISVPFILCPCRSEEDRDVGFCRLGLILRVPL